MYIELKYFVCGFSLSLIMWSRFILGFFLHLTTHVPDTVGIKCPWKSKDEIFRQLLNQETLIRYALDKKIHDLVNDVFNLKEKMLKKENDLQSKFEALKKENQELSKQLQKSKGDYVALKKEIQTLKANFQNQDNVTKHISVNEKAVGFTVGLQQFGKNFSRGIVVYPYVITNTGNGYDTKTGKFTSPRKGTYVFFVTTVSHERYSVYLDIVHNGVPEVRTMSTGGRYQTGSNMVVLELNKGDIVWVQMNAGERYYTYSVPLTTFSGFLL